MQMPINDISSLTAGQIVFTSFGAGEVSAVSEIDSIVYVALRKDPRVLYLLRPEQVAISPEAA